MKRARSKSGPLLWPQLAAWAGILALTLTVLPVGASAGATTESATVQRVSVVEEAGAVEIGIETTGPASYRAMELGDPVRYVIDLPAVKNGVAWATQQVAVGPLQAVRIGEVTDAPPVTRIVLDLARPTEWSVRQPSARIIVARLAVPEAHGSATSPWSNGVAAPERPWGALAQAGAPAAGTSGRSTVVVGAGSRPPADSITGGPPAGVPGIVVAQQPSGTGRVLTLDLRDALLGDVLDALARLCGLNMVTDASVSGSKVTVHLTGVTCDEALRFVLDANSLGYRRVGETLVVQPIARLTPPPPGPVLRVYRLQYLQPPISGAESLVGGGGASGSASVPGGAGPVKKDVAALTQMFAGTGAQVAYDDRTNSLVVTGTPGQQEAVVTLLRQLDVPIPEIVVQTLVVDITATSLKHLGVNWSIGTGVNFIESPPVPGQFGIGAVTRDALIATLTAFVQTGAAKVLSNPRLVTHDGQEALIFAGDQIPIVNTTTAGNPPVTTQTVTFQPIGVTLKIVPKINADRTIDVLVHPLVTTASSFTPATSQNPNGLPIITTREAATSLRVGDADSVVLGGLMSYSDIKNLTKIPFLGDLPLIGSLFKFYTLNHTESEVVIVLTPRIVATGQPVQQ
jgi:type IV pilus assembly protein PilQ